VRILKDTVEHGNEKHEFKGKWFVIIFIRIHTFRTGIYRVFGLDGKYDLSLLALHIELGLPSEPSTTALALRSL
jgi:hypothetical protein